MELMKRITMFLVVCFLNESNIKKGTEIAACLRLSRPAHHRHRCIPLGKAEVFLEV